MRRELEEISPRVQSLLDESGRTTAELRNVISSAGKRLAGGESGDHRSGVMLALKAAPVAIGLVRGLVPLFRRMRRGRDE